MKNSYASAVLESPGRVSVSRQVLPPPAPGEIRVRLEGCGICGSNLPIWEGRPWFDYPREPGSPGHEAWGRVEAAGDRVTRFAIGDRVALLSAHAFAEVDFAPQEHAVRLPAGLDGMDFPGEALGCAMNVLERADIRRDQWVAIIGIGFLGAVLTRLCSSRGARVIAISRRSRSLAMAESMGASHVLPLEEPWHVAAVVKDITGGAMCDRVIEATGLQAPLDVASELCAERARLTIAGYHQDGLRQVDMQLWNWRGIDVINAHERDPARYIAGMEAAISAVLSGELRAADFITHRFTLGQTGAALELLRRRDGNFIKAVLRYD